MGRKYAIRDQEALYFVTFTIVNWIDLFIRSDYKQLIIENLKYCQINKGLRLHAYCIMTSHVHLILSVEESLRLSDVIRDFKSAVSTQLRKTIQENNQESRKEWLLWMFEKAGKRNKRNSNFQLWKQDNQPIELMTNEMMDQKLEYIHQNPVKEGIVYEAEHYVYSSAIDYSGGKGLITIDFIQ